MTKQTRESVHTGTEMVAAYLGESVVARECRLTHVATDAHGRVNPDLVGFGKMDKLVELHLFAVPLSASFTHDQTLGISGVGRGYAFVDTEPFTANPTSTIQNTTAHEVAHAFGFVKEGASQTDKSSFGHCSDPGCIMHALSIESHFQRQKIAGSSHLASMSRLAKKLLAETGIAKPKPEIVSCQYDFCQACKIDMRSSGSDQLNQIRLNRVIRNQPI